MYKHVRYINEKKASEIVKMIEGLERKLEGKLIEFKKLEDKVNDFERKIGELERVLENKVNKATLRKRKKVSPVKETLRSETATSDCDNSLVDSPDDYNWLGTDFGAWARDLTSTGKIMCMKFCDD